MPSPSPAVASRAQPTSVLRTPESGPILASEVMREEAAPIEPGRQTIRVWFVAVALALGGVGWMLGRSGDADSAALSLSATGTLLAIAALPFPYGVRAGLGLLIALTLALLGLRGAGPLAGLVGDGTSFRDAALLVAASALGGSLFFRSTYAEYRRSRGMLWAAFALSLPYVAAEVLLVVDTDAPLAMRAWAALNALLCLSSLLGHMASAAGVGSRVLAALVLILLPGEIALQGVTGPRPAGWAASWAALGAVSLALLASLSLFQLLSWALAPDARRMSRAARHGLEQA